MKTNGNKTESRARRQSRIRAKVSGTTERPRLSIFKSNTRIVAQIIDDEKRVTVASVSDVTAKGKTKTERAHAAGVEIAKFALAKKVSKVVFDRGGFMYTGRVKAFADGAREGGLSF